MTSRGGHPRPGLHHALEHPTSPLDLEYAALLAGGVAAAWVGLGAFRTAVGRAGPAMRIAGGLVLAVATTLGPVSAFAELVALIVGSVGILLLERGKSQIDLGALRPWRGA